MSARCACGRRAARRCTLAQQKKRLKSMVAVLYSFHTWRQEIAS
jgi:hypothetical protein